MLISQTVAYNFLVTHFVSSVDFFRACRALKGVESFGGDGFQRRKNYYTKIFWMGFEISG